MTACFIVIIVASLFAIYQFLAFNNLDMYYFSIFKGHGFIFSLIKGMCIKWSIIIGIVGIIFGIIGLVSVSKKQEKGWGKSLLPITAFYIIYLGALFF